MRRRPALLPDYDRDAPREAADVAINSDLLHQARELGLSLSSELELRLAEVIASERTKRWLAENADAIAEVAAKRGGSS